MTCPVCHQPIDLDDLSNEVCPSCEEVYHMQEHSTCFNTHYRTGYHVVVAQHQPTNWEWSPHAKPYGYYTHTNDGTARDIWIPSLVGDNE